MIVAELNFKVIADTDFSRAETAIRHYLETLIFNGQILGREFPTAWQQEYFSSRVVLPTPDALRQQHHSKRGVAALQQLASAGLAYPKLSTVGMDLMSQHTDDCAAADALIVYSRFSDSCSAVRCASHFAPIPLYQLNTVEPDHEKMIRWQLQYQALDEIQMQQLRVLNKTAERSLQQVNSALNRQGRQLARQLERDNSKAVYYALYSGSSKDCIAEATKSCPLCGGDWRLTTPWHQLFDFRCEPCRLVSNIAWDCQSPS